MWGQHLNSQTHVTVRWLCIVLSLPMMTVRRRPMKSELSIVDSSLAQYLHHCLHFCCLVPEESLDSGSISNGVFSIPIPESDE